MKVPEGTGGAGAQLRWQKRSAPCVLPVTAAVRQQVQTRQRAALKAALMPIRLLRSVQCAVASQGTLVHLPP
jgi:hypothetical protein